MASRKLEAARPVSARSSLPAPGGLEAAKVRSLRARRAVDVEPLLAPVPSVRVVANATGGRWREAARVLVVGCGVALLVLVANRSGMGLFALAALDWGAFLLPFLVVAVGLDGLRRV